MVSKLVFPFILLLLLMFQLEAAAAAAAAAAIAKPGCPDRCGNISIAFPFGIGKDCYLDSWYEIECNETSRPPRAFISSIKLEVLNISVDEGKAFVKGPIVSSNCTGRESGSPVNLTGTPFFFSFLNTFIAWGCNTRAVLTEIGPELVGCDSMCSNKSTDVITQKNNICPSNNCCRTTAIPMVLKVFHPSLEIAIENEARGGCKQAFLAYEDWFDKNSTDPIQNVMDWGYVPVAFDWIIDKGRWKYDQSSMSCRYISYGITSTNVTAHECSCSMGYEGNAYLGCVDIDECKVLKYNPCRGITKCVNKPGTYKCEVNKVWIIIIVIAAVVGALLLLTGVWWLYVLIRKKRKIELKKRLFKRNGGLLLQQQLFSIDGSLQKTIIFSSKELEKATDRFNVNRILGQGGQGTVYKGMLTDGRIVAVKKSKILDEEKLEEFINEVVILSQINHRNVVKLLGCCLETEVPLLVYEFIPNGSLFQYLHNKTEDFLLSWEMRLQIATEVASALSYLHSAASIPVYHRDIKSSNILLDEKYRAKISDFGTSRSIAVDQTHLTTRVQGTFGYLDPEYFQSSQFTEKSDVYSFGVVLVELLSGQKPIFSASSTETRSLATHFIHLMEENKLFDILDVRVIEDSQNREIFAVANLAKRCLNLNGKHRPTMKEVAAELERIRLPRNRSVVLENVKVTGNVMPEAINDWDAASTSVTCGFDSSRTLSMDAELPLITFRSS